MVRATTTEHSAGAPPPHPAPPRPIRLAGDLLRIARPRQWLKNVLVFAAPGAAGVLDHRRDALLALGAFGVFTLAAAGTYFLNDAADAAADRRHPTKRLRPVASGRVRPGLAVGVGAVTLAVAVGLAWALAGGEFTAVIAVYAVITLAYTVRLKHEPVLDLACVSAGFVLRAVAGGVATGVPLSVWFLTVASFGSLLVVTGKRSAEHADLGEDRAEHRPTLGTYPPAFLRSVRVIAASVTVTAYCLWAFDRVSHIARGHHPIYYELSVVPFVLAVLYLELRFERGEGAEPEMIALRDHALQVLGVVWVALFALGVYA